MLGETFLPKISQASMDGPNVNWKFYDYLTENHSKPHIKKRIDIGTCGLHVIHGPWQTCNKKPQGTLTLSFARFIDCLKASKGNITEYHLVINFLQRFELLD